MRGQIYRDIILKEHARLFGNVMCEESVFLDDNFCPQWHRDAWERTRRGAPNGKTRCRSGTSRCFQMSAGSSCVIKMEVSVSKIPGGNACGLLAFNIVLRAMPVVPGMFVNGSHNLLLQISPQEKSSEVRLGERGGQSSTLPHSSILFLSSMMSCQVIYSQFGLAIHQNDHQARRRFVEWAQNEIAVVPDFHKRILFSDEAHFWLNGYVNKQNCCIWSEANPQVYVETPLHPEKLTVWCALWAGGILLQKR
ncbi:hypothetical protein TNCV_3863281 [Trichonephila clavipes]|uniref:Transposase n=1 Tax=Trichonephila clavipes TaxID=2585209 RepID=A0A8X6VG17_TRICX|nr:hypothetical protein TNCV_3863281 [Trichonephila clavipes]